MSNKGKEERMLQTEGTDRRRFWWILTIMAAIAGVVTWNVLGAIG